MEALNATKTPKNNLKTNASIAYGIWWADGFLPEIIALPLSWIGIIVAVINRKKAVGTVYESHFMWIIRTWVFGFAPALGLITIGIPFFLLMDHVIILSPAMGQVSVLVWSLSFAIILVLPSWWAYKRIKKGTALLMQDLLVENPKSLF